MWMSVNKLFLRSINKDAHLAHRADSRLAPNQWETSLQSNAVSHWLGANLESALSTHFLQCPVKYIILTLLLWSYIEYTAWGWEQLYKQRCMVDESRRRVRGDGHSKQMWRHSMETLSTLLTLCARNHHWWLVSPVDSPHKGPVSQSSDNVSVTILQCFESLLGLGSIQ